MTIQANPAPRRATRASPPRSSVGRVEVIIIIISSGVGVCVEPELRLDSWDRMKRVSLFHRWAYSRRSGMFDGVPFAL